MTTPREQLKAITGGVLGGLWALAAGLADGSMIPLEWVAVAVAAVGTYAGVYRIDQPASLSKLPHLSSTELFELAQAAEAREKR